MTTTARATILIAPLALVAIIIPDGLIERLAEKAARFNPGVARTDGGQPGSETDARRHAVAVTDKEKQIDRMLESSCQVPQGQHKDFRPQRRKLEALSDNTQATER